MKFLKNFIKKKIKLVTHNGSFHADDVFACATLSILLERKNKSFKIIRTRDEEEFKNGDYVFDVGGIYDPEKNRFDHHQKGGAGGRENGIPYSSFGLVWKKFGIEIAGSAEVAKRFDERIVQVIDAIDNGIDISIPKISGAFVYSIYDIVSAYHPSYKEIEPDFDKMFFTAFTFAKTLIEMEIEKAQDQEDIHKTIELEINKTRPESEILVLNEYLPRVEIYIELIKHKNILFVVAQGSHQAHVWRVLTLRNDMNSFEDRKKLPETWAGLKGEELQKVTGVPDAIFCHNGLFLAVTKSKEGAIKLAKLALEA